MNLKGCFLHNTDDWETPKELYDYLMERGYVDPCPLHCKDDNTKKEYPYNSLIYINPPYSKIKDWIEFIKINWYNRRLLLIPARTDTKYFHELLELNPFIYFIKGRLKFGDSKSSAPFPSLLLLLFDPPISLLGVYKTTTIEEIIEKRLL